MLTHRTIKGSFDTPVKITEYLMGGGIIRFRPKYIPENVVVSYVKDSMGMVVLIRTMATMADVLEIEFISGRPIKVIRQNIDPQYYVTISFEEL